MPHDAKESLRSRLSLRDGRAKEVVAESDPGGR